MSVSLNLPVLGKRKPDGNLPADLPEQEKIRRKVDQAMKMSLLSSEDYTRELSKYGVGSPLRGPDGNPLCGAYKRAVKTNSPHVVALLASPHKDKHPDLCMAAGIKEAILLTRFQCAPHLPKQLAHFGSDSRYASIQKNLGPDLHEAYIADSSTRDLDMDELEVIAKKHLEALDYLHEMKILHGDIKPPNGSINGDLFDFSLAGPPGKKYTLYSRCYRPLENILKKETGYPADVWALGCVLFELFTKKPLIPVSQVDGETLQADINMIHAYSDRLINEPDHDEVYRCRPDLFDGDPNEGGVLKKRTNEPLEYFAEEIFGHSEDEKVKQFVRLLDRMLRFDPDERITVKEALNHEFFTSDASSDRSFRIALAHNSTMRMRVIDSTGDILEEIDLSDVSPCYHIQQSKTPYTLQFFEPDNRDKIIFESKITLEKDRQVIEVDTKLFIARIASEAPPPSSSSSSSSNPIRKLF
jgi:serine/threonine protein kinase